MKSVWTISIIVSIICQVFLPGIQEKTKSETTSLVSPASPSEASLTDLAKGINFGKGWEENAFTPDRAVPILSEQVNTAARAAKKVPEIKLSLEPEIYVPDKPLELDWEINAGNEKIASMKTEIRIHVPEGVSPEDKRLSAGIAANRILKFQPATTTGSISWNVNSKAEFPLEFYVELFINGEKVTDNSAMLNQGIFSSEANADGSFKGNNGKVKIDIPAGASDEALIFDMRYPAPNNLPPFSLTWNPVEIIAAGKQSGKNIYKFKKPISIEFDFAEDETVIGREDTLAIYYYDEELEDWYPLETEVDLEAKTMRAKSDHLTIFDYKASYWQASSLPTVDAFKVSNFTGAGTYDINLWTPPGPAGLSPSLTLSYNSQVIDESLTYTQASWVGLGWSLDTGAIIRNMHESSSTTDDTFTIAMSGISGTLLPTATEGTITTYHTTDESFNRIEFDSGTDAWTIWDKSGTKYLFDQKVRTHTTSGCTSSSSSNNLTWKWGLGSITDINGNTITFTYYIENKSSSCKNQISSYPDTITYPNGHYRIRFERAARTDYQSAWTGSSYKILFGKFVLNRIVIETMLPNSGSWIAIRQYDFTYTNGGNNQIYPNFIWTAGGYTRTLAGIQELNGDRSVALPAVQFTYSDNMHLTKVDNGQGGTVEATYKAWFYFDDINKSLRNSMILFGKDECNPYVTNPSTTWAKVSGTVGCKIAAPNGWLMVGNDNASVAKHTIPENFMKAGSYYLDYVYVRAQDGTTSLNWGIIDTSTNTKVMLDSADYVPSIGTTLVSLQGNIYLPATFNPTKIQQRMECSDCLFGSTQFVMLPTYYQVSAKTIQDATTGRSTTFTYLYDNTSPNSFDNSDAIKNSDLDEYADLYTRPLREYRGNGMTQEINQDNLATVTWFYQNDTMKGRPYRTVSMEQIYYDELGSVNPEHWVQSEFGTFKGGRINNYHFDGAVKMSSTLADWSVSLTRSTANIGDGETAYINFRLSGTNPQGDAGLLSTSGQFFGIRMLTEGSTLVAKILYDTGGGLQEGNILIGNGDFKKNTWYTLALTADHLNGARIKIWQTYEPNITAETLLTGFANQTWKFRARVNNASGTDAVLWLDTYFEGRVYSEQETTYTNVVQYDHTQLSGTKLQTYIDLAVNWIQTTESVTRNYEGDSSWSGTRASYEYLSTDQNGTQFGNLTRTTFAEWTSTGWLNDHATRQEFWPYSGGDTHLVSLPARTMILDCNPSCDFSGSSGLLGETLNIYDENGTYDSLPTTGRLSKTRSLAVMDGGIKYYTETGFSYDGAGNLNVIRTYTDYASASASPSEERSTTRDYDTWYNTYLVDEGNAIGQHSQMGYDYTCGLPNSVTDANGNTTTASYDSFGRMTQIVAPYDSPGSPTLAIGYTNYAPGDPFHITLSQKVDAATSAQYVRYYDGMGLQIQTQTLNAELEGGTYNIAVDSIFDGMGRISKQTVPYTYSGGMAYQGLHPANPATETVYDILGRVVQQTTPNGSQTFNEYAEREVTHVDARQQATTTLFDNWGRAVQMIPPDGPGLSYLYDKLGRLIQVTKGSGEDATITSIDYDLAGRKTGMDDPDMGAWSYVYNATGSLTAQTDARGCTTILIYDAIDRLTGKSFNNCPDTAAITYIYDEGYQGARTSMSDGSGTTTWTYDNRGRKLSETKSIFSDDTYTTTVDFTTSWTYNSADLPVSMTYPDGEVITLEYNGQMLPESMQNGDAVPFVYIRSAAYDDSGRLSLLGMGEAAGSALISRDYTYYPWTTSVKGGYLQSAVSTNQAAFTLQNLSYDYEPGGNISSILDGVSGELSSFTYDALSRLTSMTVTAGASTTHSEAFTYDAGTGNLAGKGPDLQNLAVYGYDATHPHAAASLGSNAYTYDANGNQVTRSVAEGMFNLEYDAENHLVGMAPEGGLRMQMSTEPTESPIIESTATQTIESTVTETATPTETPSETVPAEQADAVGETPTETPVETPSEGATSTPEAAIETPTAEPTAELLDTVEPLDLTKIPLNLEETGEEQESLILGVESLESAIYIYDGDGTMVKAIINGVMTYYPGRHYNLSMDGETESIQKSYAFGALTIATRRDGELKWVLGDHLSSTSITANADGSFYSELRYSAFGEIRYSSGTTPTDYRYTNQLSQESIGLYYYVARYYDPELARFIQADTLVPGAGSPAAYDRYAYVLNNPIRMNDPSGRSCKRILSPGQHSEYDCPGDAYAYPGLSAPGELSTHVSILLDSLPATPPSNQESYPQKVEGSGCDNCSLEPKVGNSGNIPQYFGLLGDFVRGLIDMKSIYDSPEIFIYLNLVRNRDMSISITSLSIVNNSSIDIATRQVYFITTLNNQETSPRITIFQGSYRAQPQASIGPDNENIFLGTSNYRTFPPVISPNSIGNVSLIPSGYDLNQTNIFLQNTTVQILVQIMDYKTGQAWAPGIYPVK